MIKWIYTKIKQNHFLAMALCCAIPIVGILALSAFGVLGSWAYMLMILICPLGHVFMMRGMHSAHTDSNTHTEIKKNERLNITN
jgi:hypothetical protein